MQLQRRHRSTTLLLDGRLPTFIQISIVQRKINADLAGLQGAPAASADESRRNERQAAPGSRHTVLAIEEWSQAPDRDESRGLPLSTGDPFVDGLRNSRHSVEDPRAAVIDDPDRRTFPAP